MSVGQSDGYSKQNTSQLDTLMVIQEGLTVSFHQCEESHEI